MELGIFFIAALQVMFAASRPALRRNVVVTVGDIPSGPQCVRFSSPVCNTLGGQGYNYASFPNPIAPAYLPTHEKAEAEGNAAISLAVASKCSPEIAVFLCFSYFPYCAENQPPVLPCKSLCEKVRGDCEPYLNATYGIRWPQWADCDNVDRVVSRNGGGCISAISPPSPATAATPSSPAPMPTTPPAPVCGACRLQNKVYSTTFRLQNSNFTFAAKVSVISRNTTNHVVTYGVNVTKGYDLACKLPASRVPQSIVVQTCDERCGSCLEMAVGSTYLLGGYYATNDKGVAEWRVPCQNGVISAWSSDYTDKTDKWMSAAAKDRQCVLNTSDNASS